MSCHVHHSGTHHGSHYHTHGGYEHNGFELCHLCSDGRIEEIHRVVADAYEEVEHCQHKQEDHNGEIKKFHKCHYF